MERNDAMFSSVEELIKASPIEKARFSPDEQKQILNCCYELYETEGFSEVFWTLCPTFENRIGSRFSVIRRVKQPEQDDELLPMWRIRFKSDGFELNVYPDEVIPSEMKYSGCKLQNL